VENHIRIGGTVNTSAAKPTIHITLSCNRMMQNITSTPVFRPAVNIVFSDCLRVCNPSALRRYDTAVLIFLLENSRSTR
jgi:hypothetical protein